jgi:DNA-binding beta-propeller fold protein YncE
LAAGKGIMRTLHTSNWRAALLASLLVVGCKVSSFTIGGTVSGLSGTITLANNGGDSQTLNANGAFTFATPLQTGKAYAVTITSQPVGQNCTVTNGSGVVAKANVTNVGVVCEQRTFGVGGSVTGLEGSLTLTNNGGDALIVNGNGGFTFATRIVVGGGYDVAVSVQPANQLCTVANGKGTVGTADVTHVAVSCATFRVTASIGSEGGTLTHPDGVEVVIPPGALSEPTTIGIARVDSGWPTPLPPPRGTSGPIYEFTPHGILFQEPVRVRMPVPTGTTDAHAAVASSEFGWNDVDVIPDQDRVALLRESFSWIRVGTYCAVPIGVNDPYYCTTAHANTWAVATPTTAIVKTRLDSASSAFSAGWYGAKWAVEESLLQSLELYMAYSASPDCANGSVSVWRLAQPPRTPILIDEIQVPPSGGWTTVHLTLPRAMLNPGLNSLRYWYSCSRPNFSPIGAYEDMIFDVISNPPPGFLLGGTLNGPAPVGLELQNIYHDVVTVPAGATSFAFETPFAAGMQYGVAVHTQPNGAHCTVSNGNGVVSGNVTSIVVSCTGTQPTPGGYAIVTNAGSNNFSLYGRDAGSGELGTPGISAVGSLPQTVAITPNGRFAYVANLLSDNISALLVSDTGAGAYQATPVGNAFVPGPGALAMDPVAGSFLWATTYQVSGGVTTFATNASGALTLAGTVATGALPKSIAVHPSGNFVYVGNEASRYLSMYIVDRGTGSLTPNGTLPNVVLNPVSLAVTPDGRFAYALDGAGGIARMSVNTTTGTLSLLGNTGASIPTSSAYTLAIRPDGKYLYESSTQSQGASIQIYALDNTTGALTAQPAVTVGSNDPIRIAIDSQGRNLYAVRTGARTVTTFAIDTAGGLTPLSTQSTQVDPSGIAVSP